MKRFRGIALVQILLLAALLSVFALSISQRAHQQVKHAQLATDQMKAYIDIQSTRSQLLFELLTQEKNNQMSEVLTEDSAQAALSERWNFYGVPFRGTHDGSVSIKMQDQAGLIHVNYLDAELIKGFISFHAPSIGNGQQIVDRLLDWQDLDSIPRLYGNENADKIRNGPIPYISEVEQVVGQGEIWSLLKDNLTVFRNGPFSPLNAPSEVLLGFVEANAVTKIEELRFSGALSKSVFKELTGVVEDNDVFLYTSNYIGVTLTSKVGDSRLEHRYLFQIDPYATLQKLPINYIAKEF